MPCILLLRATTVLYYLPCVSEEMLLMLAAIRNFLITSNAMSATRKITMHSNNFLFYRHLGPSPVLGVTWLESVPRQANPDYLQG